jgi:F-type H+-transporting ATPase subunit epsilon
MMSARINLKILLPFQIFSENTDVLSLVAETGEGAFGILPHRLDCIAALAPGILTYETEKDGEICLAVDQGVLVKTGLKVVVSVRRAIRGTDLGKLRDSVKQEFLTLNENEKEMRSVATKLEAGLLRRLAEFQHD